MTSLDYRAPAPIAPSRGLTGLLEGNEYEPGSFLDTSKFPLNMVLVNVYDVAQSELIQRVNKIATANNNVMVAGVFHAGVEVYGKEWSYGFTADSRSGLGACMPRTHPQHTYRCTVPMGTTQLDQGQVAEVLQRMASEWSGCEYDFIHHNCLTFCNVLLEEELGLRRLPGWVDRAARAASAVDHASKRVAADTRQAVQFVREVTADLEGLARRSIAEEDAGEVLGIVRRDAAKAMATLGDESERLKAVARLRGQELAELAQEQVSVVSAELRRLSQDVGMDVDPLGQRASKLGSAAAASVAALWGQWEQAFGDIVAADGPSSSQQRRAVGASPSLAGLAGGLLDEAASSDEEDSVGIVRAREEGMIRRSLLDDDEDELPTQAANYGVWSKGRGGAVGSSNKSKTGRHLQDEDVAPLDWLSGHEPPALISAPALTSLPVSQPAAPYSAPYSAPPAVPVAPALLGGQTPEATFDLLA